MRTGTRRLRTMETVLPVRGARQAEVRPVQRMAHGSATAMAGGGAMLGGLRKLVEHTLKVRCVVAKDAMNCVAKGTAIAFKNIDNLLDGFENIAIYQYQA